MDNINYIQRYFLGEISMDEAVKKTVEQFDEHIAMYIAGAMDFMKFIRDYYDGEPVYPSEMEGLLTEFFNKFGDETDGAEH